MAKHKQFNITGPCIPALHYMVDTANKINDIINDYIEPGKYFTINRARQYGKTTTLELLYQRLRERYIVIDISFEGKDEYFASLVTLADGLRKDIQDILNEQAPKLAVYFEHDVDEKFPLRDMNKRIVELCRVAGNNVVLMVDEVDKASDNQVFLSFLGMLRDQYITREKRSTPALRSVILSGVHDIKNLKLKLRPEAKHSYNSPWNIAARFDVDMSFSAPEIATMLNEYERDNNTGMDISKVSQRLYYYTGGYPFLVSLLCKTIDDNGLTWTSEGVDEAENLVVRTNNTLFDDVIKNLVNNHSVSTLVERIVLRGAQITFEVHNPNVDLGIVYGIFTDEKGQIRVSNIIFETVILNYMISTAETSEVIDNYSDERSKFVRAGKLDMPLVLNRFAAFMKSEYRDEDGGFIEREGRLLFLSFLKPIINGGGHYVVEPETRGSRRMDVVVFYGGDMHIVELKIWHGEQAAYAAYDQLTGYLLAQGQNKGYLLSFCDNKTAPREGKTFSHNGCDITEVIVAYRDKE